MIAFQLHQLPETHIDLQRHTVQMEREALYKKLRNFRPRGRLSRWITSAKDATELEEILKRMAVLEAAVAEVHCFMILLI